MSGSWISSTGIFHPFDAAEITKIRLPAREVDDCVAWHYEKSGVFSVKSAYMLAMASIRRESQTSSSSASPNDRSIWDRIWKAKIPEKIKKIGWRTATKTLATKLNKHKRTLGTDSICFICGYVVENEHHAVIGCTIKAKLSDTLGDPTGTFRMKKFFGTLKMTGYKSYLTPATRTPEQKSCSYFGELGSFVMMLCTVLAKSPYRAQYPFYSDMKRRSVHVSLLLNTRKEISAVISLHIRDLSRPGLYHQSGVPLLLA